MYTLLKSLTTPTKPMELSLTEIVGVMGRHLTPKPERYKFHKRNQVKGHSIREFLAKLQKLADTYEFGGYRDEALRDRLVCGITSQTIQRKLLGVADLTLKKTVDIAVGMELTENEISEISSEPKPVQKMDLHDPCFRCDRRNNLPENCFHKDSECHTCKRKGHSSSQCPRKNSVKSPAKGKPKQPKTKQGKKKNLKIKLLGTESGSESEASSSSYYENSGDEYHCDGPCFL